MYTDSIEQLRGTAGARQVRVRAETALAAFTTPSSGGWISGSFPFYGHPNGCCRPILVVAAAPAKVR
jgi:hypothetical protein